MKCTGVSALLHSFFSSFLKAFCFPPKTEVCDGRGGQRSRNVSLKFRAKQTEGVEVLGTLWCRLVGIRICTSTILQSGILELFPITAFIMAFYGMLLLYHFR